MQTCIFRPWRALLLAALVCVLDVTAASAQAPPSPFVPAPGGTPVAAPAAGASAANPQRAARGRRRGQRRGRVRPRSQRRPSMSMRQAFICCAGVA